MIRIETLIDGIEKEIDRLANGPTLQDYIRFEAILAVQFEATQRAVHVITRSLKSSGRIASNADSNSWEGTISYGGPSTGIHNPVDYAEYERERDDAHDFLAPAKALESRYINAMNEFLEG